MTTRIALMAGSIRSGSIHRRLASSLVGPFTSAGLAVESIDLADYPMPIYDGDLEDREGAPAAARDLTELLAGLDGLVFVTPEHNGGPTALLKNTIDWITRVDRSVFSPLVIGLAAASPGSRGGAAGLRTMTGLVEHMRLWLAPVQLSIPHAGEAFAPTPDGGTSLVRPDDIVAATAFVDGFVTAHAALLEERAETVAH